jgi:hypothetical protein
MFYGETWDKTTALRLAQENKHFEVVEILKKVTKK